MCPTESNAAPSKVLVVGANGFIGSHLVDDLSKRGHLVRAFDRFSRPPQFKFNSMVETFAGDFLSRSDIERALAGVDTVIHSLSFSTPASSEGDPTFDVRTNVCASIELLEACRLASVSRIAFTSSGGTVYGQLSRPAVESDLRAPISPYGIGKSTIEDYLSFYRREWGIETVSLRISNPYGPRQNSTRQGLIPILLRNIRDGLPVKVMGDGSMIRDYVAIEDLALMVGDVIDANYWDSSVYNLGSGVGATVNEVLEIAASVTARQFDVEKVDRPHGFVDYSVLDTTLFTREFGSRQLSPLSSGMERLWRTMTA